ncbi:MAG: SusF/SusE family outer membrane protein [Bacteroidales bacterium]|nr:SusF/SusE family outer membrane protein [Bacteroidales bacterium]
MKKFLSILSVGLLALLTFSCVKEDFVTFDETKATAPVLGSYELGEKSLTASFTPGAFNTDFNQKMPVNHSLILASVDGKTVNKALSASVKDGQITISVTNLAKALVALGYQEGAVVSLDMFIRASMQAANQDNGRNGHVDSQGHITISGFEVIIPVVQGNPWVDFTEKSPLGVIGSIASTGNGWNADEPMFMTQDGTKHVAKNIVLTAADEFKVRTAGSWDNIDLGGPGDEKYVAEIGSSFEAVAKGKNIAVPADGAYDILYDSNDGTITITEAYQTYPGYDQKSDWGITGSVASRGLNWDKDISMITDGEWHVAEGVELTTEDAFKFRTPGTWNEGDFGGPGDEKYIAAIDEEITGAEKGKDIAVAEAGVYDILFNPTAGLFKITPTLGGFSPLVGEGGGSDEPVEEKAEVWSIIGVFGGSHWDKDVDMTNTEGDVWVIRNQAFAAGDEFKIRADHDWDSKFGNYGGPEENSTSTAEEGNPYGVYAPELGTAFEAGSKNIQIIEGGNYDITYDCAAKTIKLDAHIAAYSLIGTINGDSWTKDVIMTESDGIWTSPVVNITGGFKIRYDFSWADENTYGIESGATVEVGKPITLVQPGSDINLPEAGDYKVTFNPETKEATVISVAYPEQLYMIGAEFGSWDWNSSDVVEMTPVLHHPDWGADAEGQFWTVRYFTAGQGFKFNSKREWGGDFWGLTTNEGFTEKDNNCVVAESGLYMVHVDFKREIVHVEPARIYGIGDCFGAWDEGMEAALYTNDGKTAKLTVPAEGKMRIYAASSISTSPWWTREFDFADGQIIYRGAGDERPGAPVLKGQEITLNFNAGTAGTEGEGEASELPEAMYMIGEDFGSWNWDSESVVEMIPVNGKAGQFWAIRYIEAKQTDDSGDHNGFKFCAQKAWSGDFTNLGEDTGYTVSGGNCFVEESGVYMIYVNTDAKKITIEKAKVYGIGGCFGGWDEAMEGALFAEKDGKLTVTVPTAGEIRMYAASSAATSDWWTREFVFFDGKIAYRGNGGDQDRVTVEAGKTVTLDFNAGTAVVE